MKTLIAIAVLGWMASVTGACPVFDRPNESLPTATRVLYQKIWLYKNPQTQMIWARINPLRYYNSVAVRFPTGTMSKAKFQAEFSHVWVDPNDDWGISSHKYQVQSLKLDEHFDSPDFDQTDVYYVGNDSRHLYIKQTFGMVMDSIEIELILQYVPPLESLDLKGVQNRSNCSEPSTIHQSIWRAGLPDPVKGRNATPTEHCIVHHSASGNGDTNYTELVRSYYTFHTQVNGWDDIGYNYLIAANGTIYAGRDPEKAGIEQDNVQGAHFCGKNNLTMGVCMIGDFTLSKPTDYAMQSLYQLLGWKIHKDTLNPYYSFPHPGKTDPLLSVIAGHRDGCNTACPGDSLFMLMDRIKTEAAKCMQPISVQHVKVDNTLILATENGWTLKYIPVGTSVQLYDITGRRLYSSQTMDAADQTIFESRHGVFVFRLQNTATGSISIKTMR